MLQRWLISAGVDLLLAGAVLVLMVHGDLPVSVGAPLLGAMVGARARAFLDSGPPPPPPPAGTSSTSSPTKALSSGAAGTAIGALLFWVLAVGRAAFAVSARASPWRLRQAFRLITPRYAFPRGLR